MALTGLFQRGSSYYLRVVLPLLHPLQTKYKNGEFVVSLATCSYREAVQRGMVRRIGFLNGAIQLEPSSFGQLFSAWVEEKFPGLDTKNDAEAALWYASELPPVVEKDITQVMSSPRHIREWFNNLKAVLSNTDPVLSEGPAPVKKISVIKRMGKRLSELWHRKQTNDEGSPIAAKAFTAYSKQHNVTEEELKVAAQEADPDTNFRFDPPIQLKLDRFRSVLTASVDEMKASGIPPEAIRVIYIQLATPVQSN